MIGVYAFPVPPLQIASAISLTGAFNTAFHVGNFVFSNVKLVACDRMMRTKPSSGSRLVTLREP